MRGRIGFFLTILIPLSLLAWQVHEVAGPEVTPTAFVAVATLAATSTVEPTMTSTATAVPPTAANTATTTPLPSHTATATATATTTNTPTVVPTATATATALPQVDRTCPDPAPLKPEYDRYYLPPAFWPQPDLTIAEPHFWLSKPIPGGGRYLINQTFPYGYDAGGRLLLHNGVDAAQTLGMPVLAVADGTIVVAQADFSELYGWRCDWYGHLVVLELDQQWRGQPVYVLYGHVLNISVEVGQAVKRGEQVAEIGFGGAATVPHLHLEVRVGTNEFGSTRNPMLWIEPGETRGVIIGRLLDPEGRPWQGVGLSLIGGDEELENRNTWSYLGDPQNLINPDEGWAENFVFSDVRPGEYDVYTKLQGVEYRASVTVTAGEISTVEIITEPYKTPTPAPEPTATVVAEETGD
ncbi:MAG: peptidoglycan DD-metalloendopeptidase family protein [Ardenticatenaceae bacterium]|nr:peptidoglycan DD-metalloendopeptidase family protein [Ardenticatenaceae bacterium]